MARAKKSKKGTLKREFDPTRWAHLIFVLGGFLGIYVLSNLFLDGWDIVWSYWPQVPRTKPLYANIAAIVISVAATLYAWRKERWFKFCTEVVVEVSQVTWPTRAETRANTVVVLVMTLICSGLLWTMDQTWSRITNWLYGA